MAATTLLSVPRLPKPEFHAITESLRQWAERHAEDIDGRWRVSSNEVIVRARSFVLADLPRGVTYSDFDTTPVWGLFARMGTQTYSSRGKTIDGSLHFAPGTKLYVFPRHSGDGHERTYLCGSDRETKRFALLMGPTDRLVDWYVDSSDHPALLYHLERAPVVPWHKRYDQRATRLEAEGLAASYNARR